MYRPVGEGVLESMVLALLESGVGRDISGGEIATISAKGSTNVDLVRFSRGGTFGRLTTGCAHSGIFISTYLGLSPVGVGVSVRGTDPNCAASAPLVAV